MSATEPVVPASAPRSRLRALLSLVCVAILVYGADQLSKHWVVTTLPERVSEPVLGELLQFTFVRNPGAAFSLASGSTWIFSIAAAVVTVVILVFARRIRALSWALLFGMLLGGVLGNLTDRLLREPGFGVGHVIDFIEVWGFPAIFNIADIFIVSSMGLFVILTLRGVRLDGTRESAVRADDVLAQESTVSDAAFDADRRRDRG
ncbi:signal peptidase II [Homoserinimonas sedimenticola]|uniref:signal peptidase II n=1 Tax=Homoserinimonas sedimenticola TaxID=2986805 RepID=UPI0027E29B9D|nr:signal peptidase II [Salinibacterium sedimenticola]